MFIDNISIFIYKLSLFLIQNTGTTTNIHSFRKILSLFFSMKLHFCLKVTSFQEPIFDPEIFSDAAGILSPRKDTKKDAINVAFVSYKVLAVLY